jgi:nicotinamide phosphoribosyltransferase
MISLPFPLRSDSYKLTHWRQYPPKTTEVYSYLESRGGLYPATVFFGLQYYLHRYLSGKVVLPDDIANAYDFVQAHIGADHFNTAGWRHIVEKHNGRLPVEIAAVQEGTLVPTGNVLMTIRNTDPACYWLPNFLETLLLKVWYPITVATRSFYLRQQLRHALVGTGEDPTEASFMLHDFGYRGVSSEESAAIGGASHLTSFEGSDTVIANALIRQFYYGALSSSGSVPATEHSTMTSWGREQELNAYQNVLAQYPTGVVSIVADSYDVFKATETMFAGALRDQVESRDGLLVIRPDSGNPVTVAIRLLEILRHAEMASTVNQAGYRKFDKVRVLWGDGINDDTIRAILKEARHCNYAASNFVFGMGGALLQKMDRDMQKFAFKCSSVTVDGRERDVFKDPITDPGKSSKRGKLGLYRDGDAFRTGKSGGRENQLQVVFRNGQMMGNTSFEKVRSTVRFQDEVK